MCVILIFTLSMISGLTRPQVKKIIIKILCNTSQIILLLSATDTVWLAWPGSLRTDCTVCTEQRLVLSFCFLKQKSAL